MTLLSPFRAASRYFGKRSSTDVLEAPATLPQELIELILDATDKTTLRACSLVSRSFLHTSQKHIFSELVLSPPSRFSLAQRSGLTLKRLAKILAGSPHLAVHVRSLTLIEGCSVSYPPWMRTTVFATTLMMFVNLTCLSIGSQLSMDWDSFPPPLVASLRQTVALPSFASLELHNLRFGRSTEFLSLIQCSTGLRSLVLSQVPVFIDDAYHDGEDEGSRAKVLRLVSLDLGRFSPQLLMHTILCVMDAQRLQHLCLPTSSPQPDPEMQRLLAAAVNLEHCHIRLQHYHTDAPSIIDLKTFPHLHTLEMTFSLALAISPAGYDPIAWAARVLATWTPAPNPDLYPNIKDTSSSSTSSPPARPQIILNIHIDEHDLPHLPRLAALEPLVTNLAMVQTLTVRLDAVDVDFDVQGGEREILEAFPVLRERGRLEVVLFGVS